MSEEDTKVAEGSNDVSKTEAVDAHANGNTTVAEETKTECKESAGTPEANGEEKAADEEKSEDSQPGKKTRYTVKNPPKNMLKVLRPEIEKGSNKSNFDPAVLEKTDDPNQIRTQVQFYFSNSNLSSDKFMSEQVGGLENKSVPVPVICSFKRMRRFQPVSAVIAALKESDFFVIEGDEGKETIRRRIPFDPTKNATEKVEERSVYVKGFGEEEPSTQFEIEAFFSQFGEFNSVRLRRGDDKGFKGSVFVEWADKETAEKFLDLDPEPKWKEHDLLILSKKEYMSQKNEGIRDGSIKANDSTRSRGRGRGRGGNFNRGRGGHRDRDTDSSDWKKRREEDQKNGFNDRRGGRNHRGRGRGRGNFRGRNDKRDNERPKDAAYEETKAEKERPKDAAYEEVKKEAAEANGKRAREDDHDGERAAKKVDTKETA